MPLDFEHVGELNIFRAATKLWEQKADKTIIYMGLYWKLTWKCSTGSWAGLESSPRLDYIANIV